MVTIQNVQEHPSLIEPIFYGRSTAVASAMLANNIAQTLRC